MRRYLEIDHNGFAFHQPDPMTQFTDSPPPREVVFCDCRGVGVVCHHVYAGDPDHEDAARRPDRHFHVHGNMVKELHQNDWKAQHRGPRCAHRRQIFVDVTDRPDAQIGMMYNEATDTFSKPDVG